MREDFLLELIGLDLPIKHQINRRLKHVYLQIKPQGLVVKTPGWSEAQIRDLILKQKTWITKKTQHFFEQKSPPLPEQVLFLGHTYRLKIDFAAHLYGQTTHSSEEIQIYLPPGLEQAPSQALTLLDQFFKDQARTIMYDRLIDWSCRMDLQPQHVRFKRLKSRWGSCSSLGNINLNYRAIQLPLECIDSILVHELAHLKHLNHSQDFWGLVHQFIPNYAECKAKIRNLEQEVL